MSVKTKNNLKKVFIGAMICFMLVGTFHTNVRADDYSVNDEAQNEVRYLEDCPIVESARYTGNMGDSFIDKIGENQYTRGNVDINGNTYEHGIEAWIARWNWGGDKSWAWATFDLNNFTGKLQGDVVLIKSYNVKTFDTTVYFYADDNLIYSYNMTSETVPFSIDLSLVETKKLKIFLQDNNDTAEGGTSFGFANMVLSEEQEDETHKFVVGRDNNRFDNSQAAFFRTGEKVNYKIDSEEYRNALYANQDKSHIKLLQKLQNERGWGGSCYGISASVLYGYYGVYDVKNYIDEFKLDTPYYWSIDAPSISPKEEDTGIRDLINVFHLSQYRSDMKFSSTVNNFFFNQIFEKNTAAFLQELVEKAKEADFVNPFILSITYKKNGHSVIVCGLEEESNDYYKLAVCDPNGEFTEDEHGYVTDGFDHKKYNYLMVKTDYSEFHMENSDGETIYKKEIDSDSYKKMAYVTYEDAYSESRTRASNDSEIIVNMDCSFYMSNGMGEYLSYDGENFEGTLYIDEINPVINSASDGNSEWIIKFADADKLEFTEMSTNMKIDCLIDSDDYISVSGDNLEKIVIENDKEVVLSGSEASFEIWIEAKDEAGTLLYGEGTVEGDITFSYEDNNIKIDGIKNIEDINASIVTDNGFETITDNSSASFIVEENSGEMGDNSDIGKDDDKGGDSDKEKDDNKKDDLNTGKVDNTGEPSDSGSDSKEGETSDTGKNNNKKENIDVKEKNNDILKITPNQKNEMEYIIKPGDTLRKIAMKLYGDSSYWKKIYADNRTILRNPNYIYVGQKLLIYFGENQITEKKAIEANPNSYVIKPNDNLWKIALKKYKNGNWWVKIYEANRNILVNPKIIHVGQTIVLP